MIRTETYKDDVEFGRDLLAAYSALDHRSTAELHPDQLREALTRLLTRLSTPTFRVCKPNQISRPNSRR
jgi:hypothetical protein